MHSVSLVGQDLPRIVVKVNRAVQRFSCDCALPVVESCEVHGARCRMVVRVEQPWVAGDKIFPHDAVVAAVALIKVDFLIARESFGSEVAGNAVGWTRFKSTLEGLYVDLAMCRL